MRMSELSERSGVSVPSIKFYQREQLLHDGEHTSATQTSYDETHVERLRLVRALIEIGGLSVSSVRAVLAAVEADIPLDWAFGVAQHAIPRSMEFEPGDEGDRGVAEVEAIVTARNWTVAPDNPGRAMAARVIDSYVELGHEELLSVLPDYAEAASIIARVDLAAVGMSDTRAAMAETVVVGTVLGDALLAGLRRMAQESVSHHIYRKDQP
ncbi:MAG: MerR family transcriptional regulator [Rhodoglobus sp.]